MFMVRRVCFTPRKAEDENDQRHNFYTHGVRSGAKYVNLSSTRAVVRTSWWKKW
jgi:hypothetical protein